MSGRQTIPRMLYAAMVHWESRCNRMDTNQRMEVADACAAIATKAARLSGGKHADAVKAQNDVARLNQLLVSGSGPTQRLGASDAGLARRR